MQVDISAVCKTADLIKKRLGELDRGNEQARAAAPLPASCACSPHGWVAGCWEPPSGILMVLVAEAQAERCPPSVHTRPAQTVAASAALP